MNSTRLAERVKSSDFAVRIRRAVGPAGVFLRGFLEHPRMVGSVIPSSRAVIEAMLAPVDWQRCRLFIEYGPGVGTFCRPILDRLPGDGRLLAIDTNPLFVEHLRRSIGDSRFTPVLGSAAEVEEIVQAAGEDGADYVLSGLPFSTLPDGVGPSIVAATHRVIRPGGAFLTYQFSAAARDYTARHFDRLDTDFVWANIPPCILTWGWKERNDSAPAAGSDEDALLEGRA